MSKTERRRKKRRQTETKAHAAEVQPPRGESSAEPARTPSIPGQAEAEQFQPSVPGVGTVLSADAGQFRPCAIADMSQPSQPAEQQGGDRDFGQQTQEILQQARGEAEEIIAEARQQAARLQQETEQHIEQLLAQLAGQEAAKVREEQTARFEAAAEELLERFQQAADMTLENLGAQVGALAAGVAGKVIHRKVAADDEIILDAVAEALRQLSDIKRLRIVLNPADQPVVSGHQQALLRQVGQLDSVEIVSDEAIERGGCLLDSDRGEVDGRISSQLEVIWKRVAGTALLKKTA